MLLFWGYGRYFWCESFRWDRLRCRNGFTLLCDNLIIGLLVLLLYLFDRLFRTVTHIFLLSIILTTHDIFYFSCIFFIFHNLFTYIIIFLILNRQFFLNLFIVVTGPFIWDVVHRLWYTWFYFTYFILYLFRLLLVLWEYLLWCISLQLVQVSIIFPNSNIFLLPDLKSSLFLIPKTINLNAKVIPPLPNICLFNPLLLFNRPRSLNIHRLRIIMSIHSLIFILINFRISLRMHLWIRLTTF